MYLCIFFNLYFIGVYTFVDLLMDSVTVNWIHRPLVKFNTVL